jgi:chromosome transmission fidelity protein 1
MVGNSIINEQCRILRENTGKKKCELYKKLEIENTKDLLFDQPLDIEDTAKILAEHKVCPYYSARSNSNFAQILCVPYNMIVNNSMRESLKIDLKNSILVFDEAHNLMDNIIQNYNHRITYRELFESCLKIKDYINKYKSRLRAKNVFKLEQISMLFDNFMNFIKDHKAKDSGGKGYFCYKIQEVILKLNIIDYNLFELKHFIDTNQLGRKLNYFSAYSASAGAGTGGAQGQPQDDGTKKGAGVPQVKIHGLGGAGEDLGVNSQSSIEKF